MTNVFFLSATSTVGRSCSNVAYSSTLFLELCATTQLYGLLVIRFGYYGFRFCPLWFQKTEQVLGNSLTSMVFVVLGNFHIHCVFKEHF